jgi:hypothetical protein
MIETKGIIFFFDKDKGEGQIVDFDGNVYDFYYDAIENIDRTQKDFWISAAYLNDSNREILKKYSKGAGCSFTVYKNLYQKKIERIWID